MRQWRVQEVYINPVPDSNPDDALSGNAHHDRVILPNGRPELSLPQGSNGYTPWCKQILKIARSGKLGKRKERDEEHEDEKENGEQDEVADAAKLGFTARKWGPLPRSMEEPEREYLAPRRPGLPKSSASATRSTALNGEAMMNGATVEEPSKRRMPPPRRKPKKGPGRRKKMTEGDGTGVSASAEALEGGHTRDHTPNTNGETRSGADGAGDDNDEDEEEGDEGGDGADDDREEGELSDEKEEEAKELLSTFKGDITQDSTPPITVEVPVKQPAPPVEPPKPVDIPPLPGLGRPTLDDGKEEGEIDAEEEEEDYEPPPPKPAGEDDAEDDECDYEPPPPTEAVPAPVPAPASAAVALPPLPPPPASETG